MSCTEVGCTHRNPNQGGVLLDPVFVADAHEAEGADAAGDEKLDSQNGVDLADELVANVDCCFGDAAAELGRCVSIWEPGRRCGLSLCSP